MSKFIYVFSKKDRDILLAKGAELLKNDESSNIYVFMNDSDSNTVSSCMYSEMSFIVSDTLTF